MQRGLKVVSYALALLVIANGVLVGLKDLFGKGQPLLPQDIAQCNCRDVCGESNWSTISSHSYAEIATQVPHIDPSYHTTRVRLGSELNFNYSRCPAGAYMRHRRQDFAPKHSNCPTLFLVGARKAGTSSLYHYLSNHPDFEGTRLDAGPKVGETFYFTSHFDKNTWDQYTSLFPSGGVMTGDASVGNLVHKLAPRRIYDSCGKQARVVMLFRDPVTRLESNFLMRARLNSARLSNGTSISTIVKLELDRFFQAVLKKTTNVKNLAGEWSRLVGLFDPAISMVYEGLYYTHLLNWLCNFPAENILIVNSEEFFHSPSKILDIVVQFLGLRRLDGETYDWITSAVYNRGKYSVPHYQRLSHTDKVTLLGVYRPFNKVLLELLGWSDSIWMNE